MTVETISFAILAVLAIAGAFGLILSRNPVYALLYTLLTMFSLAAMFLNLHAEFIAVIQVIVYAGAIMVLFLFVINLLNLQTEDVEPVKYNLRTAGAFFIGLLLLVELLYSIGRGTAYLSPDRFSESFSYGKVEPIGQALMTAYVFPFEMISVILIVALIGAMIIAKKHAVR